MSKSESGILDYDTVCAIRDDVQSKMGDYRPEIGIILGSGLGGLGEHVEKPIFINYKDVSKFPSSTVAGHKGRFVVGLLSGKQVLCMQGRFHCYEGYHPSMVTLPIRVMSLLGVKSLLVTNASGGLNSSFNVGDLMIIQDHINLAGMVGSLNPLIGPNEPKYGGERFIPTSKAYDKDYSALFLQCAEKLEFTEFVRKGVYIFLSGPCFESIAEARMLKVLGADAVGMSTVPEVLVARHCGMRVLGVSLVTNAVITSYDVEQTANHEEVLETGRRRAEDMVKLVKEFLSSL